MAPPAAKPQPATTRHERTGAVSSSALSDAPIITVPPGFPSPGANRLAQREFPDQWSPLKVPQPKTPALIGDGHATHAAAPAPKSWGPLDVSRHPYTSYWGNYWTNQQVQFPWKAIGKLMIRDGKSTYTGTAQVIYSAEGNLLVTAAHNVWNAQKKRPVSGLTFIPAERDGVKPFGQFESKSVRLLARYTEAGDLFSSRDDVALIRLQNNSAGKPVSYYTGWLGLKINVPYAQNVTAMGYSASGNVESRWTTVTTGQTFYFNNATVCKGFSGGEDILFMGSDLGKGASGGAWVANFRPYISILFFTRGRIPD